MFILFVLQFRVLSWQRHNGSRFVSFTMYISGAKFESHRFNISRDMLDRVLDCFSGTTYDVNTHNTKNVNISKTKKGIPKRKMPFYFTLKILSNQQQLFFTS